MLQTHITDAEKQLDKLGYSNTTEQETHPSKPGSRGVRLAAFLLGASILVGGIFIGSNIGRNNPNVGGRPVATDPADPTESAGFETETPISSETAEATEPAESSAPATTASAESTPEASASQSSTPEQSATTTPEAAIETNGLEINSELISNPEELLKLFINDRLTSWMNAGSTKENAAAALEQAIATSAEKDATVAVEEYAEKIASGFDDEYINSLFIKGWENNPALVKYAEKIKAAHRVTVIANYFTTNDFVGIDGKPMDAEPYKRWAEFVSITDSSNENKDVLYTVVVMHERDNSEKNRVGEDMTQNEQFITGDDHSPKLWFVVEGDALKLSNIIFAPEN